MSTTDRPKKEEFVPLYEKLVAHGFDLGMLIKDDFFVSSRFSPNTTLIEAFQLAAMGGNSLNIPYFWHYRKKHRKRNPASISILDICKSGDYVRFTPSVAYRSDTALYGPMGLLTYSARFITKIFRIFSGKKSVPESQDYCVSNNFNKFKFNLAYEVLSTEYLNELSYYVVILKHPEDEGIFIFDASVLGKTDSIYLMEKQTS